MSALVSVVAKVLVLVDEILNAFITTTMTYPTTGTGVCNIPAVDANLTACGQALVSEIQMLIY